MAAMIRATRKGGSVAHLMRTADAPSVCGRVMVLIPGGEGLRLCKSCARITGVQADIDTRTQDGLPVVTDWTEVEQSFIKGANDSFTLGMCREVLAQYESHPEDYATPHMLRHVAMMRAALNLHTGRDYVDPVDAPEAKRAGRGGDGMVNPNSKSVARSQGATPNQRAALMRQAAFIDSLFSQLFAIQGKSDDGATQTARYEKDGFFDSLTTRESIDKEFKGNSALIDRLKEEIRKAKQDAPKAPQGERKSAEDGYYVHGDTFVCVKWNRAGTGQYATVWNGESWEYDRSKSYALVRDVKAGKLTPMTPEDAKRFGDLYGTCFKCSRTLTDPESIAQGYGPICAGKMGW
ncbi:hypothetical protein SEA_ALONE_220 [Streptomyces phage Alone3]|nr:hypothetical protein SEA_ALONE_220 [Streptomyces phage Alone3]